MSNQSFSDLPSQQRRERIAVVLILGVALGLDQGSKISANSLEPSLELLSGLRLSVSQPDFGDADDAGDGWSTTDSSSYA
jgi:hypothetical protein